MSAAIAEQQRYIASLQQQISAHQAILNQSACQPPSKRAPMAKPVYKTAYAPAPGYVVQQPVVVYGLDGIGSTEPEQPPAYDPPPYEPPATTTSGGLPVDQRPAAAGVPSPEPTATCVDAAQAACSAESQPATSSQTSPQPQAAPSARAARRAPLRTSATVEPVRVAPPSSSMASSSQEKVSIDAETIRAQRKSSTADHPMASELEQALRDLQQAPDVSAPLDEFKDIALPGMETISLSSGESLEVLKAIAEQYEAKKMAAEAELSAMQAQARAVPSGTAPPCQERTTREQKKEPTVDECVQLAQEVEGWLAKEISSPYPSEHRISKLLTALKGHLQPVARLKKEREDIASLIAKTREHDMRAGEMLTVPPLDDSDWLYDGASDSESDEDFYFVEDMPSDMALDPLC